MAQSTFDLLSVSCIFTCVDKLIDGQWVKTHIYNTGTTTSVDRVSHTCNVVSFIDPMLSM